MIRCQTEQTKKEEWLRFLKCMCITAFSNYACSLHRATQTEVWSFGEVHSLIPTVFTIYLGSFFQLLVLCPSILAFRSFRFQCHLLLRDSVLLLPIILILCSFFPKLSPLISPYAFISFFYSHLAVSLNFSKFSFRNFFQLFRASHYLFFLLDIAAIPHWNCRNILIA